MRQMFRFKFYSNDLPLIPLMAPKVNISHIYQECAGGGAEAFQTPIFILIHSPTAEVPSHVHPV